MSSEAVIPVALSHCFVLRASLAARESDTVFSQEKTSALDKDVLFMCSFAFCFYILQYHCTFLQSVSYLYIFSSPDNKIFQV